MNEKFCISIKTSMKFVPKGPIDKDLALDQIIGRAGDKPSSELILGRFTDTYMWY